jgi:hypothetical protein
MVELRLAREPQRNSRTLFHLHFFHDEPHRKDSSQREGNESFSRLGKLRTKYRNNVWLRAPVGKPELDSRQRQ